MLDKEISNKVSAQEERGVRTLSIAPSGHRQFVAGNWDGTINFVSAGGKSKTVKAFARLVLRIAYSPNGKFVLSGGSNLHGKNLKLWDAQSEDYIRSFLSPPSLPPPSFSLLSLPPSLSLSSPLSSMVTPDMLFRSLGHLMERQSHQAVAGMMKKMTEVFVCGMRLPGLNFAEIFGTQRRY